MKSRPLPPQAYLRECFDYAPETGELRWRHRPPSHFIGARYCAAWNTRFAGQPAGNSSDGRRVVILDYIHFKAYRLIFKWMTGLDPVQIDHRDQDPTNNRWSNLRDATEGQNHANVGARRNNLLGLKGVSKRSDSKPDSFVARIRVGPRNVYLGRFDTQEEDRVAYVEAARARWGEFAAGE